VERWLQGKRPFEGFEGKGTLKQKALRWQRPFDIKAKGILKGKTLRCQMQSPFEDKSFSEAKTKAILRQRLFKSKGLNSFSKAWAKAIQ
jgi:hypothetical protein